MNISFLFNRHHLYEDIVLTASLKSIHNSPFG